VTISPSIEGFLLARLDRLGPAERNLIRAASVLGMSFPMKDLLKLVPARTRKPSPGHLESLIAKHLIDQADDGVFAFRHVLVQLVAYRTLTKGRQGQAAPGRGKPARSAQGRRGWPHRRDRWYHLEQALRYRRETNPNEARDRRLATRAGERLLRAGRRAFGRFDPAGAKNRRRHIR